MGKVGLSLFGLEVISVSVGDKEKKSGDKKTSDSKVVKNIIGGAGKIGLGLKNGAHKVASKAAAVTAPKEAVETPKLDFDQKQAVEE
jgi:hypothetical protein